MPEKRKASRERAPRRRQLSQAEVEAQFQRRYNTREERIVRRLWNVFAKEGMADSYGSTEYERARPIIVSFMKKLALIRN